MSVDIDYLKKWEIPSNWIFAKLEDFGKGKNAIVDGPFGSNLKRSDYIKNSIDGVPVLTTKNLYGDYGPGSVRYISKAKYQELKRSSVLPGDILVAKIGSVGKTGVYPQSAPTAIIPANLLKYTLTSKIEFNYVYSFLNSYLFQNFIKKISTATAQPAFNVTKFRKLPIPLPPLNEQKRIVAKIEELFSELDKGIESLKKAQKQLKVYRQAVLKHAFEGKLTEKWREENKDELESADQLLARILQSRKENWQGRGKYKMPENPSFENFYILPRNWVNTSLDQICIKITDGTHHSPTNKSNGDYKYITAKNIKEWGIDLNNVTYVTKEVHEEIYSRCDVKTNDVLYIKDGATTGIATINNLKEEFSLLSSVGVFRPVSLINPHYLSLVLNSPLVKKPLLKKMAGSAITRLTLTKLKVTPIPVPPLEEQEEIVKFYFVISSKIESLEKWCTTELVRSEILRQSILKKAFSGELVSQDPNDEPASVLLDRIKAEKTKQESSAKKTKSKPKSKRKSAA